ncbi:hypothetical protein EV421DRAFT_1743826 [Armillaria borealis]|uniref:Uncharacterized protein n=1 Tax=Armillaria borealis TaxID=47425 RepID=A0AA39IVS4_9AGAR|nr:hypothetical protein EV421DRAFT_1743826 [Armillaria borealis]
MADNAPCDYFYRSQLPVNIPEHLNASILKEELDIHHAVDILAELSSHRDHIPTPSFYELLENACSSSLYQSPPRWFKNGIIISSSRFPPDRLSSSVGADKVLKGDVSVCKKRIANKEPIKPSARNPTWKIAPLPRRARKSNGSWRKRNKNEAERLHFLQHDSWVQPGTIKPQEVVCRGCGKTIQLEHRTTSAASGKPAKYYLSPWVKHRNNCRGAHRDWLTQNGYDPEI